MQQAVRWVLRAQGALYVVTGVWPLLHMRSFEAVTGPKTDDWLVYTVGLLLAVIGGVLIRGAGRATVDPLTVALGIATAIVLVAVEVVHVFNGTISRIYLLDAAIETAIAVALVASGLLGRQGGARPAREPS